MIFDEVEFSRRVQVRRWSIRLRAASCRDRFSIRSTSKDSSLNSPPQASIDRYNNICREHHLKYIISKIMNNQFDPKFNKFQKYCQFYIKKKTKKLQSQSCFYERLENGLSKIFQEIGLYCRASWASKICPVWIRSTRSSCSNRTPTAPETRKSSRDFENTPFSSIYLTFEKV